MTGLSRRTMVAADRRAGAALARAAERLPGGAGGARVAAGALAPAFRAVVALLIVSPRGRRAGAEALAAGTAAAAVARLLRDVIGRRRPGPRPDGGFPSRHAAAAVAIATAVRRRDPALGAALTASAAVGLAARVAARDHEPADIAAGALLGVAATALVARASRCAR